MATQSQATAEKAEWIAGAPGLGMDPDGSFYFQCKDVADQYGIDIFAAGLFVALAGGDARTVLDGANPAYYEVIRNDTSRSDLVPIKGDVIVWGGSPANPYGHVAIVKDADPDGVTVVQQDGFAAPLKAYYFNDGTVRYYSSKPTHEARLGYWNAGTGMCTGWLRPKPGPVVYTGADKRGFGAPVQATTDTTVPRASIRDGIDVSNHQPGIELGRVPADFVGVLATDGATFTSPTFAQQITTAQDLGKPTLAYHFARVGQSDSDTQARRFLEVAGAAIKRGAVPVLDWEEDTWNHRADWAIDWINYVERATGSRVVVYQRIAASQHASWGSFRRPMWLSWYGSTADMIGYATDFSGMPEVPGWDVALWQYSDHGQLTGYSDYLDLNRYFGGIPQWDTTVTAQSARTSNDPIERIFAMQRGTKEYQQALDDIAYTVWAYKNQKVNGSADAYELLTKVPERVLDAPIILQGTKGGPYHGKRSSLRTKMAYLDHERDRVRAAVDKVSTTLEVLVEAVRPSTIAATVRAALTKETH